MYLRDWFHSFPLSTVLSSLPSFHHTRATTDFTPRPLHYTLIISLHAQGVLGSVIVNDEGEPIRATTICDPDGTPVPDQDSVVGQYAELIPQLASMARSMVRDLDPQNNLQFLRIRSKNHEIMVHSDVEFTLIVIQNPSATE